jgi:hypothetical protein
MGEIVRVGSAAESLAFANDGAGEGVRVGAANRLFRSSEPTSLCALRHVDLEHGLH